MAPVRIELLGRVRARRGARIVDRFRSHKTAALFGYLAFHLDRAHPREVLAELFWGDATPNGARGSLSRSLSSLRAQLEPPGSGHSVFVATQTELALNPSSVSVDVHDLLDALRAAESARGAAEKRHLLEAALDPFPSPLMPAHYDDWVLRERDRLAERSLTALEELVEMTMDAGNVRRALSLARLGISADPLRESAHRLLMRVQLALGKEAEARRQLEELRDLLARELDAEPEPETMAIFASRRDQVARSIAPARAAPAVRAPSGHGRATWTFVSASGPKKASAAITRALRAHGGEAIEVGADEWLAAFRSVEDGVGFAIDAATIEGVRAGLHTADVTIGPEGIAPGTPGASAAELVRWLCFVTQPQQVLSSESAAVLVRHHDELGVDLADLGAFDRASARERVFRIRHPKLSPAGAAVHARPAERVRLPLPATSFVGREAELAALRSLLGGGGRLVTLVGLGGTGKTRLAIELSRRMLAEFEGGVFFAALAEVASVDRVPDLVAELVGAPRTNDDPPVASIRRILGDAKTLLVLDNVEHLLPDATRFIATLLEEVMPLTVLVTSRQPLSTPGERVTTLGPMVLPPPGASFPEIAAADGVQLFVDRSQAVAFDFRLSEHNAPTIVEICHRVSGIPLGIELAAARMQMMSPERLLSRLTKRLDLLASARANVLERQRTLSIAIEWSVSLLSPDDRAFLAALTVFPASWDIEAASAVTEDPLALDRLSTLCEHALVDRVRGEGEPRFGMLDVVRAHVEDRLGPRLQRTLEMRYAEFYAKRVETIFARPPSEVAYDAVRALDADIAHYRRSVDILLARARGRASDRTAALRLAERFVSRLAGPWLLRGRGPESQRWLEEVLAIETNPSPTVGRGLALSRLGEAWLFADDPTRARPYLEEAAAILAERDYPHGLGIALNWLADIARREGNLEEATRYALECLPHFGRAGVRQGQANVESLLASIALQSDDLDGAEGHYQAAVELAREHALNGNLAEALAGLGAVSTRRTRYPEARSLYGEAIDVARQSGTEIVMTDVWMGLHDVALGEGRGLEALSHARQAFLVAIEQGNKPVARWALGALALRCADRDDLDTAAKLMGALRRHVTTETVVSSSPERALDALRERLEAPRHARLVAWGLEAREEDLAALLRTLVAEE